MRSSHIFELSFLILAMLPSMTIDLYAADPTEGEQLFKTTCTACHHLEMRLVGPALKNVHQRHDEAWMLKFIKSSQTMVQSGDSAAVALFNTYNQVIMPDHNLSDDQIRSILAYLHEASTVETTANPITRPETVKSDIRPLKFSDYRFWILYTVTVLLVIVAINYKAELVALHKKVDAAEAERASQAP